MSRTPSPPPHCVRTRAPKASLHISAKIVATCRTTTSSSSRAPCARCSISRWRSPTRCSAIAERLKPYQITLVPERREEVTTEGGLDVAREPARLRDGLARLKRAGVRTSLFIDPDAGAVQRSHDLGADAIELHTGTYAHDSSSAPALRALATASELGRSLGLAVHAGHGLTVRNVGPVAAIAAIEELNIGHSIVSRAIFVGLAQSIAEMREAMVSARGFAR